MHAHVAIRRPRQVSPDLGAFPDVPPCLRDTLGTCSCPVSYLAFLNSILCLDLVTLPRPVRYSRERIQRDFLVIGLTSTHNERGSTVVLSSSRGRRTLLEAHRRTLSDSSSNGRSCSGKARPLANLFAYLLECRICSRPIFIYQSCCGQHSVLAWLAWRRASFLVSNIRA